MNYKKLLFFLFAISLSVLCSAKGENYLKLLKSAKVYNVDNQSFTDSFLYQNADNKNLQKLRLSYKLDSVAGTGTDIEQAINLMSWVHNKVKHNGSKGIPGNRNAMAMLDTCKKENLTLNCRGMAILLNEVYLSMGYKSRYVTCMPKDSTDRDCHVINMVYINSLNKWVWMDPTFEAFVMDENSNLLSIEEVRQRLINDKYLKINKYANWNNRSKQKTKRYLYKYMAKNLYRIECSLSSEYNYETREEGKQRVFIQLIPTDYLAYKDFAKESDHGMKSKKSVIYIGKPYKFWAKPE